MRVIEELKPLPVEVLIPDLCGEWEELKKIVDAGPYVLNHNIETVPRLYKQIRPQAIYKRSLKLLKRAKELNSRLYVKSGFMVGLGETDGEVFDLLQELKSVSCDIVTIGQYLPPSRNHAKPERFVDPSVFEEYKTEGEKLGLKVFSGPFVRSSYQASKIISLR